MHILSLFNKYKNWFVRGIEKPALVFAKFCNTKSVYYASCIVGKKDDVKKTVLLYFLHNEQEKRIHIDDIIYHHSNLMMRKASFRKKGKVCCGIVYGNDSPKYEDGEPRSFYIRVSKRDMVTVPVRNVFLTKRQAEKLLVYNRTRCRKKSSDFTCCAQ